MGDGHLTGNAQQQLWNGVAGQGWTAAQVLLDAVFNPFEDLLVQAIAGEPDGALLDIGCGTGAITLAAARAMSTAGASRHCTGIDISRPMLELARARAAQQGIDVDFIEADAQIHHFKPGTFGRIVSRFGVMFFDDPIRAFANLRGACRDQATMRFIAWRSPAENPFMTTAERAAAPLLPELPRRDPDAPGQFAFADPERIRHILDTSGWSKIDITAIDVPCALPQTELEGYFTRLGLLPLILPSVSTDLRDKVIHTVRAGFQPFVQEDMVRFNAACWLVDARA